MRTVIAFDISDRRKRARVVKALRGVARRVQKSVFEAEHLDEREYLRLRSKLEGLIDPSTDSLRYYRLCGACVGRVEHGGARCPDVPLEAPPTFRIIAP
jgi:CRISPR-associated protein Cas2